jgi:Na+/pantothenate symporter
MSVVLMVVILIFLFLGGLLYLYAGQLNMGVTGDKLFPEIALQHMPPFVSVIFIIALISALFPVPMAPLQRLLLLSVLISSVCSAGPILLMPKEKNTPDSVHLAFALIFLLFVWCLNG